MRRRAALTGLYLGVTSPAHAWIPRPACTSMMVLFRFGSTEYNNPDKQRFPSMAYEIRTNYFGPIKIVGHTAKNESGGMALSLARAEAVRDQLIASGISPAQITSVEGVADRQPWLKDDEPNAEDVRRRVEIFLKRDDTAC